MGAVQGRGVPKGQVLIEMQGQLAAPNVAYTKRFGTEL